MTGFNVRFKSGQMTVMLVHGNRQFRNETELQSESDAMTRVPQIEADLEKLTGLRVHVEQTGTTEKDIAAVKPAKGHSCPDCGQPLPESSRER